MMPMTTVQAHLCHWLTTCQDMVLMPIKWVQKETTECANKIKTCALSVLSGIRQASNVLCEALYSARYTILYLAASSIVAINDFSLFAGSSAVGALLALVQHTLIPLRNSHGDASHEELAKSAMLIQVSFSFIHSLSKVMSLTHWMTHTSEGAISATLSGLTFGYRAFTSIKQSLG